MSGAWDGSFTCTLADHLEREYAVPLAEALGDPDFRHLYEQSQLLCSEPSVYVERLQTIAVGRLRDERFVGEMHRTFDRLREHLGRGEHPPHLVAEALQIAVSDLSMIEEVSAYGAPREVVDELCTELAAAALFTAGRLVLNLGRRLRARRSASPLVLDPQRIQPLAGALRKDPPEVLGNLRLAPAEPVLVVATAGRGTRLRTTIPKALLPLAGCSFLGSILAAARRAGIERTVAVVKHRARLHPKVLGSDVGYVVQHEALGTGHSFATALRVLENHDGPCVLSYSDTPFLTPASFRNVVEPVAAERAAMTILAVATEQWPDFGRLEESEGRVRAILQPRFGQQGGDRADGGLYACRVPELLPALLATRNGNHRYEYSFTEVCAELDRRSKRVTAITAGDPREVLGVNRPADLVLARRLVCELQAGLEFFRSFGGDPGEGLAPSEMLELAHRYGERAEGLVGAVFVLDERAPRGSAP